MFSWLWGFLLIGAVCYSAISGTGERLATEVLRSAKVAVDTLLGFVGVMCLWLGLMKIAEESGMVQLLGRLLRPALRLLFPSVPNHHPASGALVLSISANLLGMGSAATPLGLQAMRRLAELNPQPDYPSDPMCTLVAINAAGLSLVPTAVVALRASMGSAYPTAVVGPTIFAGTCATAAALMTDWLLRPLTRPRRSTR